MTFLLFLLRYAWPRPSVDSIIAPVTKAIEKLDRLAEDRIEEADQISDQIENLYARHEEAHDEAHKARRLQSKLLDLVNG